MADNQFVRKNIAAVQDLFEDDQWLIAEIIANTFKHLSWFTHTIVHEKLKLSQLSALLGTITAVLRSAADKSRTFKWDQNPEGFLRWLVSRDETLF